MKNTIIRKLTSRKLWIAIVGIVVGLATAFGVQENEYAQIVGTVGSIVSAITYIMGESLVDAANKVEYVEVESDEEDSEGGNSIGFN